MIRPYMPIGAQGRRPNTHPMTSTPNPVVRRSPARSIARWMAVFTLGGVTLLPGQTPIDFSATERCGESFTAWPLITRVLRPESWSATDTGRWTLIELDARQEPAFRIPLQLLSTTDLSAGSADRAQPGPAIDFCFPITLKPGETRRYRLLPEPPADPLPLTPHRPPALSVEGTGPGSQIDTGSALFGFHPGNGQFGWYTPKNAGITNRIGFRQGQENACHHNPDVWCYPRPWGHTSDWHCQGTNSLTPTLTLQQGPLLWRFERQGDMPYCDGVKTRVSYTLLAGLPLILESSSMEFTQPLVVYAVRNNELVFSRGLHTHAAYPDAGGEPVTVPAYDLKNPSNFFGRLPVPDLDPDIPWVALYHAEKRYGIALLNLERWTDTGAPARPINMPGYYYFMDYGQHGTGDRFGWNFLYFCRAEIFTITALPAGSAFHEHSAILVLQEGSASPRRLRDIEAWRKKLEHPPRIRYDGERLPL